MPEPQESDPPELGKQMDALKVTLHSNSALLQLKLQQWEAALSSASKALEVPGASDAEKGKAYYRRALARAGKKADEEAVKDLEAALKCVPGDPAITKELGVAKKRAEERKRKEKAAYSKFFS